MDVSQEEQLGRRSRSRRIPRATRVGYQPWLFLRETRGRGETVCAYLREFNKMSV